MHIDSTDTTLKRYLEDIRRTAPLSREEEQILFQKAKEGDKIARKKLISANMRFAAAVAEAGMLIRNSEWKGTATWDSALELVRSCGNVTGDAYKEEFLYLLTLLQRGN